MAKATRSTPKKKPSPVKRKPSAASATKPKSASVAHSKPARPSLSADERNRLLKPRTGADDLGDEIAITWKAERGLRVDGLSANKLQRYVRVSRKCNTKEAALADAQARKMAPIRDARMLADDTLWRALLDLRAAIALRARRDPAIEERFAALLDALKSAAPADVGSGTPTKPAT